MRTRVSFTVYGDNLGTIEKSTIAELARFSTTDFQWDISLDVTEFVQSASGETTHYKAEVSAWPKPTYGWQGEGS